MCISYYSCRYVLVERAGISFEVKQKNKGEKGAVFLPSPVYIRLPYAYKE